MAANADDDRRDRGEEGPRYQPLMIVLVAACAGIVVDRVWPWPVGVWWATAAGGLLGWMLLWSRRREAAASCVLCLTVAATAASWHHCRWFLFADDDLGYYCRDDPQPICVEAIARQAPRGVPPVPPDPMCAIPLDERTRLDVQLVAVRNGSRWQPASGRTTLEVHGQPPQVEAGRRLRIFGQLSAPLGAQNPGEFDYARYYRADRRRSYLRAGYSEGVSAVPGGSGWSLFGVLDAIRDQGNRVLHRHLDDRYAALAAAVLLGAREQLDQDRKQTFMETGTIHLLAISGLHVGILAGALLWLAVRAPVARGPAMSAVAATVVVYMLVTDARPPVIRAAILTLVLCWSLWLHRRPLSFNSLALAALVVLAVNPAEMFQTGAQLSFLAVGVLIWFAPLWTDSKERQDPLKRLIAESRGWFARAAHGLRRWFRQLFLVSAVIWLLALPLVMARFHLLTPSALVLNPLLWPVIAVALMSGFSTLLLGALLPPLGEVTGSCCNGALELLEAGVTWARDVPGSHYWVPGPEDWWLLGFYGGVALLAACPAIRPPRRWCLALLAVWTAVGFAAAAMRHDDSRLDCTVLSMGHGCAVVVELPSGQTMLYDAGRLGAPNRATQSVAGFLWSRGLTHLDAVVLSHGDVDHYNALPGLLERFSIGAIYVSPVMFENTNPAMEALQRAVAESGVPIREIRAGDLLASDSGCRIEVLHPPKVGALGSDNANSVVVEVEHLGHRILLPGDLDSPGTEGLLAEEPTDYDVLLAPHHGGRSSNPPGMAQWSTPDHVVVSGSRGSYLAEIETTYRDVGAEVIHTGDSGAVRFTIDSTGLGVERFRDR